MSLHIYVITGKKAGVHFEVKANLKFGRTDADFILDDRSASSQHAQIKEIAPGEFILIDLKSKNGIKINGLKEVEVHLTAGLMFVLGNTLFEVKDLKTEVAKEKSNLKSQAPLVPPSFVKKTPEEIRRQAGFKSATPSAPPKFNPSPIKPNEDSRIDDFPKRYGRTEQLDSNVPTSKNLTSKASGHKALETKVTAKVTAEDLPAPSSPFSKQNYEKELDDLELDIEMPSEDEPQDLNMAQQVEVSPADDSTKSNFVDFESSKLINVVVNESWNEALENLANRTLPLILNKELTVSPFNPALRLTFTRGLQVDTEWVLGYGPRKVGAHEYDLTIFEPKAPELCFELLPLENGILFKTQHKDKVLYNQRSLEETILKAGDLISIGSTTIRIELIS